MFDPAVIGTTILRLESERRRETEAKRREAEVERHGCAIAPDVPTTGRNLTRDLARWLRSAADRLEPAASSDTGQA